MESKGFVALFSEPLDKETIGRCVEFWLENFDAVEQVCPGLHGGIATQSVRTSEDVVWESHPQFRVLMGNAFAWIYLSAGARVIETTGFSNEEKTLCLEVLTELPGIEEIIDQNNERRLDELEARGII